MIKELEPTKHKECAHCGYDMILSEDENHILYWDCRICNEIEKA